jgi:hypothetical protein
MNQIDRKVAAKLLKLSIRTVDRYIAANKLSAEKRDGRIWLNRREILALKKQKRLDGQKIVMSMDKMSSQDVDDHIQDVNTMATTQIEQYKSPKQKNENNVYKKLFEELKEELKIKQERLEGANYRVGQLEAMVKKTVPLLDHQRLLAAEKTQKLKLEKGIEELKVQLQKAKLKIKEENISKKVYLIALFIFLMLQPFFWLFLQKQ